MKTKFTARGRKRNYVPETVDDTLDSSEGMSERELVSFIARKVDSAMNDEDGDLSQVRQENFNSYIGAEYGNEREGYSKFITREVLETVEWVLPSVLRVFLSGDRVVEFDPVNPEDEKRARQETDIINHLLMNTNNGGMGSFIALHHWMKDCLMNPNGYVKLYMDETRTFETSTVQGLTDLAVKNLENRDDVEITEINTYDTTVEGPEGLTTIPLSDVTLRVHKTMPDMRLEAVPPDECLVDNDSPSVNLDEADFVCHRVRKTFTELVNRGYDPDELRNVGAYDSATWNDERVNRLFFEDENPDTQDEDAEGMQKFWVHECSLFVDFDGDGLAERRYVTLIGGTLFENTETDYQPFVAMSAILMQHKHTGMSYIDIVKDLQILNTTLVRQLLDNIYQTNVRRDVVSVDSLTSDGATMEALLNVQAEVIPVEGPANMAIHSPQKHPIVGELLPVIKYASERSMMRTGVSPESQVDPNALQEVRQDVYANAMDRASQRIEMLVKIFAETGFRQVMLKAHQLLRANWNVKRFMKIRGEWIDVDPTAWGARTDMTVNVGLGTHTKQQQLTLLTSIAQMQKEALMQGMSSKTKIYNTLERIVSASGLGDARSYFTSPEDPNYQEPQPPPPDPQTVLANAQAKALESESMRKQEELKSKTESDRSKAAQASADKQAELNIRASELRLRERELALKERELSLQEKENDAKVSNLEADTELKKSKSDEAMADAATKALKASDTFKKALSIVDSAGDVNADDSDDISIDTDGEHDE